jgi:ATP sulfurylase
MNEKELLSVLHFKQLPTGETMSVPLTLHLKDELKRKLEKHQKVALKN